MFIYKFLHVNLWIYYLWKLIVMIICINFFPQVNKLHYTVCPISVYIIYCVSMFEQHFYYFLLRRSRIN